MGEQGDAGGQEPGSGEVRLPPPLAKDARTEDQKVGDFISYLMGQGWQEIDPQVEAAIRAGAPATGNKESAVVTLIDNLRVAGKKKAFYKSGKHQIAFDLLPSLTNVNSYKIENGKWTWTSNF